DADQEMYISLRDFRPHVGLLAAIGEHDLANQITQDYLDSYALGLNTFIRDLRAIVLGRPSTLSLETGAWKTAQDYTLEDTINAYARHGKLLPIEDVLHIGWGVARDLDEEHRKNQIHGNLSPA